MGVIGTIIVGGILWWLAHQHDKKMNENFMNFLIRFENLENRAQELEISNEYKDRDIKDLEEKVRDLEERIFKFENHL